MKTRLDTERGWRWVNATTVRGTNRLFVVHRKLKQDRFWVGKYSISHRVHGLRIPAAFKTPAEGCAAVRRFLATLTKPERKLLESGTVEEIWAYATVLRRKWRMVTTEELV